MKKKQQSSPLEKLSLFLVLLIVINIGILVLLQNQVKTIALLKEQRIQLQTDQKIIASSEAIYIEYENDIDTILSVFPDESSVLDFIQTMERLLREYGSQSSVRLSSKDPLPEGDKLFLLFNLTFTTDINRFVSLLEQLESLPYMTRTLSITTQFSDSEEQQLNVTIPLKLYVKNPFTAK